MSILFMVKRPEELGKAKRSMASAYILGMIDRGECNQAKAVLDTGALDMYMDPKQNINSTIWQTA
ncbi:MAG: hypothetical protein L6V95_09850 [Candidatus Melainabacteria bacterium]|nr:MAG: hypothetical protein L6V95_09850 [Candidatus Melainabacteria bacterium]